MPPPHMRNLRDLYLAITGDVNFWGVFNPDYARLQSANSGTLTGMAVNALNKAVMLHYDNMITYRWYEQIVHVLPHDGSTQQLQLIHMDSVATLPSVCRGCGLYRGDYGRQQGDGKFHQVRLLCGDHAGDDPAQRTGAHPGDSAAAGAGGNPQAVGGDCGNLHRAIPPWRMTARRSSTRTMATATRRPLARQAGRRRARASLSSRCRARANRWRSGPPSASCRLSCTTMRSRHLATAAAMWASPMPAALRRSRTSTASPGRATRAPCLWWCPSGPMPPTGPTSSTRGFTL